MSAKKTDAETARALSQFYTNPEVAATCIACVKERYPEEVFARIIEPAAGTGAFSNQLGDKCVALDLDPKAPGIYQADFLDWHPEEMSGRCLVIGNPPFAEGAALDFINHAAGFADVVAFILPRTFRKKSQQNRVATNLHLVHEEDIPAEAFSFRGKVSDAPCIFQIWERRNYARSKHELRAQHPHFVRCPQDEADVVIRRVGAHAGALKPVGVLCSAQSNIFLKAAGCSSAELRARFEKMEMGPLARNGAAVKSINMTEIVELYEHVLLKEQEQHPAMRMLA